METAKIFENGRSQAVRIPKQYRLPEGEVLVQRIGNSLILTPKDKAAENFIESLSDFFKFLCELVAHRNIQLRYNALQLLCGLYQIIMLCL